MFEPLDEMLSFWQAWKKYNRGNQERREERREEEIEADQEEDIEREE